MSTRLFFIALLLLAIRPAEAQQTAERYIEVTGTSEIKIVPDKIHYVIEIREYFEEEFDGKSKPEEYRTKVPLARIEEDLRKTLRTIGIMPSAIRTQEVGDYYRQSGQDFLVSKRLDLTLHDFKQIEEIVKRIDTRGVQTMRIGELENKDMLAYHRQGKIEALKAARQKATYLVEAVGKKLGGVLRIVEQQDMPGRYGLPMAQSNVISSYAASFDEYRIIKRNYSVLVRFEIADETYVRNGPCP